MRTVNKFKSWHARKDPTLPPHGDTKGVDGFRVLRRISVDQALVPNAMSRAVFLLKRPLTPPPPMGAATEWNVDHSTDSVADLSRGRPGDAANRSASYVWN